MSHKLAPEGPFVLSTAKMMFKLSKKAENDKIFYEGNIIDSLMHIIQQNCTNITVSWEILIYAVAALKNITCDSSSQNPVLKHNDIIPCLADIVAKTSSCIYSEKENIDKNAQLLIQVTASLRNLAISNKYYRRIMKSGVLNHLIPLLNVLPAHTEFVLNTCRVLR